MDFGFPTYWLVQQIYINKSSLIFLAQNTYNYWGDSLFLVGNKIHKLYCWKIEEKWATQEFLILSVVGITQLFFSFSSDLETAWLICFSAVVLTWCHGEAMCVQLLPKPFLILKISYFLLILFHTQAIMSWTFSSSILRLRIGFNWILVPSDSILNWNC